MNISDRLPLINCRYTIIGYLCAEEWSRWLRYLSPSDQEKYDSLNLSDQEDLTIKEQEWLNQINLEKRVALLLSAKKKLNKEEVITINNYMANASIAELIKKRFPSDEYEACNKEAQALIDSSSLEELDAWCESRLQSYKELSMHDAMVLRIVRRHVVFEDNKKDADCLKAQLTRNMVMRNRSENASSSILK